MALKPILRRVSAGLFALLLTACVTIERPINPRLEQAEPSYGYRWGNKPVRPDNDPETLLVVSLSGGGMRAAAFAYGVLEEMHRTHLQGPKARGTLTQQIDVITSVSGGSFTGLAFAQYGDALFDFYERDFLARDVQGDLISEFFDPAYWGALDALSVGRSEVAERYYDKLLFKGATFDDLLRKPTPLAIPAATALSTGTRISFTQHDFDALCSDLGKVPLARAAAASSAVPFIFSPLTFNNYGGTCGYSIPAWARAPATTWPGTRYGQHFRDLETIADSQRRPYLHLIDGGLSGNLGLEAIVDEISALEASPQARAALGFNHVKRVYVIVVNARSSPSVGWDRTSAVPPALATLIHAIGIPIDRYSLETVDAYADLIEEWNLKLALQKAKPDGGGMPAVAFSMINVSFEALADATEREYLFNLPTSLALAPEQVTRLRAAGAQILRSSSKYRDLVDVLGGGAAAQ
jgi:NTE family protein